MRRGGLGVAWPLGSPLTFIKNNQSLEPDNNAHFKPRYRKRKMTGIQNLIKALRSAMKLLGFSVKNAENSDKGLPPPTRKPKMPKVKQPRQEYRSISKKLEPLDPSKIIGKWIWYDDGPFEIAFTGNNKVLQEKDDSKMIAAWVIQGNKVIMIWLESTDDNTIWELALKGNRLLGTWKNKTQAGVISLKRKE